MTIVGRGESTNAVVAASTANQRARRGPALGMAVETNETRITELHTLDEEHRVSGYHDITNYAQYKKVRNPKFSLSAHLLMSGDSY